MAIFKCVTGKDEVETAAAGLESTMAEAEGSAFRSAA